MVTLVVFQVCPSPTLACAEPSCLTVLLLGSRFWKGSAGGCREEAHMSILEESFPGHFPEGKENGKGISSGLWKPWAALTPNTTSGQSLIPANTLSPSSSY